MARPQRPLPLHPSLTAGGALAALLVVAAPAVTEGVPGEFDFYVLALTWSPGYCVTDDDPDPVQCEADHGFVVHGLWPEYERGWPEYCRSAMRPTLGPSTVAAVSDLMPSAGLVAHQWRKHGLCSGLEVDAYFALVRAAVARVTIPVDFANGEPPARLSPAAVEQAFAGANVGLSEDAMSVQCRGGTFTEVRICVTRDLAFRPCAEVDAARCRARSIAIPQAQ